MSGPRKPRRPGPARTVLVLGGTSDIAQVTLSRLVGLGLEQAVLAVREPEGVADRLAVIAPKLAVLVLRWDATAVDEHRALVRDATAELGEIDLVVCAVGKLGHAAGSGMEPADVDEMIRVNFGGTAAALAAVGERLADQGHGTIVVLSSVAGVRPRRSNYVYGATKAGLDAFARGLGDSLRDAGIRVVVVRAGFVRSRSTEGLTPAPFATDPGAVASAIVAAIGSGRSRVVWVPRLLGPLFGLFRILPAPVWRRVAGDR